MALRGVTPKAVNKRLKLFTFGGAGVGKTTAAIQFPSPYLIDTERGAENEQYRKALEAAGGVYMGPEQGSTSLDEIIKEVRSLLSETHPYRTVIIDPMTVPYNDACDQAARELADEKKGLDGTEFGRHKAKADRKVRTLIGLLLQLDMNVIITSHQKALWERSGGKVEQVGVTFDCYNKIEYTFDLVIEVQKRGKERVGIIRKTRIEAFEDGKVFPFSYAAIADLYGHEVLERAAGAIELATTDQAEKIAHLVKALSIPQETIDKWMDKANAESFSQFPRESAEKALVWLEAQLNPHAPKEEPK